MEVNLKQFRYVLTLAAEGSFSRAAEALNIKQPSLSQYIKKIEQELGTELFTRVGGNVCITDAGRAYIEVGRKMLDLEHQLEGQLADLANFRTGTVTVGISAHRSVALMPEIVALFRKKYPGIVLKIDERKRGEIIDAAEHGEFDLCLTTLPVDGNLFSYETAMREENVLAVPAGSGLKGETVENRRIPAVPVSVINGMDFVMLNAEHPMQRELDGLCETYRVSPRKTVECTSLEAALEMTKHGIGASYIPSCLAKDCEGVEFFSFREETANREIVILHRREQYLSQAVQDLKEIILTVLKEK